MKMHNQWLGTIFGTFFSVITATALINFAVDPLQLYRKATFYRPFYHNERAYVAGLAKHFDYDSVIIGTSMTENFTKKQVDKTLGINVLKLSISGASAFENKTVLETAIHTGKVKNVFYGLDIFTFRGGPNRLEYSRESMPLYLYDDTVWNDYKYLLSLTTLKELIDIVASNGFHYKPEKLDPDTASFWDDDLVFSKEAVLKKWREGDFLAACEHNECALSLMTASFNANLLPIVKAHPEIHFDIFYPPYSVLAWEYYEDHHVLNDLLAFKEYISKAVNGLPNVTVYDFQTDASIITNLDNYKDVFHYSPAINNYIIEAIAAKKYVITVADSKKNTEVIQRLAIQNQSLYNHF